MTEAIEQLASKLSVAHSEIEDFLKKLSIRFDQPVTAQEVLGFLETYKGKLDFDNIAQQLEKGYINRYIRDKISTNNENVVKIQSYVIESFSFKELKLSLHTILKYTPILFIEYGEFQNILRIYNYDKSTRLIEIIQKFSSSIQKDAKIKNIIYLVNLTLDKNQLEFLNILNNSSYIQLKS
ncbi:hypothetical protein, partial [Herpetosiphon giganteus]|uniref:hypothetical protein n=1 Tax=Herpetosiphon giganteus TaxID=2029754 RepID=UPI00195DB616